MQNKAPNFHNWIGNTETIHACLTGFPMAALAATLNKPELVIEQGKVIPPLWHWLYFLETCPQAGLAQDGHAEKGEFLPPISLPRRMWAGSRIEFFHSLHIGDMAERTSTIKDVIFKNGRSGALAFVTVEHQISGPLGIALKEQHDIVYRDLAKADATPAATRAAPATAAFSKIVQPDPVWLFRYSALTFNGHRIHYDRDFARSSEGYSGLVVHGPLLATLMVELLMSSHPGSKLHKFEFKAMYPVFDLEPFTVCCDNPDAAGVAQLWVQNQAGALCMHGSAVLTEI